MDMEFKQAKLDNGLVIIGELNANAKSAAVGFFVKTGSRDETTDINGVSHFLEHMLFKGTDALSPAEVNEAFDRTGAKFNAFTSEENTVYYAAVLPEYLSEIMNIWGQLLRPSLREEDFTIEKNVIKEEIAMYKDMPDFEVTDLCRALYFADNPCGYSVLGTNETIDALKAEQMRDYFNRQYAPNNITLAVTGNFDWSEVCKIAQQRCGHWQTQKVSRKIEDPAGSIQTKSQQLKNLTRQHICLLSKGTSAQSESRFAAALLSMIIGDSTGSRYYWQLVDKAIAETAVMQPAPMDGTGTLYSYFQCDKKNADRVMEITNAIFKDISQNGVTEKELSQAKNKILSALVIKNEIPMGRLVDLGFNWMYLSQYRKVDEDIEAIKGVTVGQIGQIVEQLQLSEYTSYTLMPSS